MRLRYVWVWTLIFFSSCVTNKKVLLLQDENELSEDAKTDEILRSFDVGTEEYKIQPNDILSIEVSSLTDPEFNFFRDPIQGQINGQLGQQNAYLSGFIVNQKGDIEFPVVGGVNVAGLTIREAEMAVKKVASKFLKDPVASIRILNFRVTIMGEVENEGLFNNFNNTLNIIEAIGLSGGFTDLADRSQVKVVRNINGQTKVFYVDLLDENLLASPYYTVHNNDILIIPPLKQRPFRRYFGNNLSLFVSTVSVILLTLNLIN